MKDVTPHHINYGGHHDPDEERQELLGCDCVSVLVLVLLAVFCVICSMTSCTSAGYITKEIPVYVHDTLTSVSIQADTLIVTRHDSVWNNTYVKGDTVFVDRGRETTETRNGSSVRHDTVTVHVEVPVKVTETVTETIEVEKPLSWWQKTTQGVGLISIIASVIWLAWKLQRRFGWLSRIIAAIKALFKK